VEVVLAAVAFAALPGAQRHVVRPAAVDAVPEFLVPQRLAGDDGDLLAAAAHVGGGEGRGGEVAKGTFFSNSCWISRSSSGKVKMERQSAAFHRSSGSASEAD
jgi:hypothetical protein